MSEVSAILILYEKKGSLMGLMKEIYTNTTTIVFDSAECVECGEVIEFSTDEQFDELSTEHICYYMPS